MALRQSLRLCLKPIEILSINSFLPMEFHKRRKKNDSDVATIFNTSAASSISMIFKTGL